MTEAKNAIIQIFLKLINFIFDTAEIESGVTVGYVLLAVALITAIISTLAPRIINPPKVKGAGYREQEKDPREVEYRRRTI